MKESVKLQIYLAQLEILKIRKNALKKIENTYKHPGDLIITIELTTTDFMISELELLIEEEYKNNN